MQISCKSAFIYLFIAVSTLLIGNANNSPIWINLTGSMPRGIYYLTSYRVVHRGDYVMVCLPSYLANFALARGYLKHGSCKNHAQPLLKQIAGETKDTVVLSDSSIEVNNIQLPYSSTLNTDSHHRIIPAIERGIHKLKQHQLWLYGLKSSNSWDSRYFGTIESSYVIGVVKPLLLIQIRGNS